MLGNIEMTHFQWRVFLTVDIDKPGQEVCQALILDVKHAL